MSLLHLYRLVPPIGLLANRSRYPGLHCGLGVEIEGPGELKTGANVRIGERTRIELATASALKLDDDVQISRAAHIALPENCRMHIGAGTTVQDGCRIYGDVIIGPWCIFAPNVFVSSGTHVFDAKPEYLIHDQDRLYPAPSRTVRIFSDCWFGINTVISPGVTIGRGCVLGANSVVTEDLAPYSVAAGSPARVIRKRLEFSPKARIDASNEHDAPYFYDGFELSPVAQRDAFVAGPEFTLALAHPNPRGLRLSLSATAGGEITFERQTSQMPRERGIVEFALGPVRPPSPYFAFRAAGGCRVHTAELV